MSGHTPWRLMQFRKALDAAESVYDLKPFMDDGDDYSACPCFQIGLRGFRAEGHCWRTYLWRGGRGAATHCACEGVGLHVWGDEETGRKLASLLTAADWYGEWPLVIEGPA